MAFDPDLYLQAQIAKGDISAKKRGFDPDAYLQEQFVPSNVPTKQGPFLGGERPAPVSKVQEKARTILDYLAPVVEVPLTLASSIPAGIAYGNVPSGSSPEAYQQAEQRAARYQYQPQSPVTQDILGTVGEAFNASKLPPFVPGLGEFGQAARQSIAPLPSFINATAKTTGQRVGNLLREEPQSTLSGVGAAQVPAAEQRIQLAQNLRVPVKLTKGQATKELGQQQLEAEIAKTYPEDVGKPLVQHKLDQNQRILSNFDAYVEATGAETAGPENLTEVGKVVDKALVAKANKAKAEINKAYKLADEAGESAELIDVTPVKSYLDSLKAEEINAPVITSAKIKLDDLAKNGKISLNDLEEVRKMVRRVSGSTATNMEFGKEIIGKIDAATEGKGGNLYKNARALRAAYAKEFENVGYVDKLLSKKPGTSDRAVAFEDVFKHSILNGSLDDTRAIGRTLKKAGAEGEQAWKELQGQTIEYMKDQVTKNIFEDQFGNRTVSPKQLDIVVKNLDKSGKLEYLFGKKGAQEIRDLRDTAINVYAVPQGINTSNTSSAITQAFDRIRKSALSKIPAAGPLYEIGAEAIEKKKLAKDVTGALEFNPKDLAKGLKKENK